MDNGQWDPRIKGGFLQSVPMETPLCWGLYTVYMLGGICRMGSTYRMGDVRGCSPCV